MKSKSLIRRSPSTKPRLLALEGPAGVGKTTLQYLLWRRLVRTGINAKRIPEFSKSRLGKDLRADAAYGKAPSGWITGMGGTFALLADKTKMLETASSQANTVWICDRLITSQLVLGIGLQNGESEREITKKIVYLLLNWIQERFSDDSVVVFLNAPLNVLKQRLQTRLGYPLTTDQTELLKKEIREFQRLSHSFSALNSISISSDAPVDLIEHHLMKIIFSKSAQ